MLKFVHISFCDLVLGVCLIYSNQEVKSFADNHSKLRNSFFFKLLTVAFESRCGTSGLAGLQNT